MKREAAILSAIIAAACIPGCGRSGSIYSPVDPGGWDSGRAATVSFFNDDTLTYRNIDLFAAYSPQRQVECGDVAFEISVTTPDSLIFTDTVKMRLPGERGTKGNAMQTATAAYRRNARLMREGEYIFRIRHTAPQALQGIRGVGIEISETRHDGER